MIGRDFFLTKTSNSDKKRKCLQNTVVIVIGKEKYTKGCSNSDKKRKSVQKKTVLIVIVQVNLYKKKLVIVTERKHTKSVIIVMSFFFYKKCSNSDWNTKYVPKTVQFEFNF